MKNREKFRKEIIKSARTPEERLNVCELVEDEDGNSSI